MLYTILISALLVASKAQDACGGTCTDTQTCIINVVAGLPSVGVCNEPECDTDADCAGAAICMDTAIGGVCKIECAVEGEACTDPNGVETTCKLFPADSFLCGVPYEDNLSCVNGTTPTESQNCTVNAQLCTQGTCPDGTNCAVGPDGLGQCQAPQCEVDADCDTAAGETCLLTAIGGVCRVECMAEGEACTDAAGVDTTCKLYLANSMMACGVPLVDNLSCTEAEPPTDALVGCPDYCRTDAQCVENNGDDTLICLIGVDPALPDGLGMCTNAVCKEGTCPEGSICATLPDGLGQCVEPECTIDDDCDTVAGETCLDTAIGGVCRVECMTEGEACTDANGVDTTCKLYLANSMGACGVPYEDNLSCTVDEPPTDALVGCPELLLPITCTTDAECAAALNDTFICVTELGADEGICSNALCKEGTCGEGIPCVLDVAQDFIEETFNVTVSEDIGVCLPGACYNDMQCAEQMDDSYVCVIGLGALMNVTAPSDLGGCSMDFCSADVDNCELGQICAVGIIPGFPDVGLCGAPECMVDEECEGDATCLETAIGGVCRVECDVEGEACTDADGVERICQLFPANSMGACGVPLEDNLSCTNITAPTEGIEGCPTMMPTMMPTTSPVDGGDGGSDGDEAGRVLLFGVMAVIGWALVFM